MNVYFEKDFQSFGIGRVVTALRTHLPHEMSIVDNPLDADLIVLHVIGRNEHVMKQAQEIKRQGKQYAVIQYALQSTRNPSPSDWLPLWKDAKVVWSYYDLQGLSNFYHAPLAANPEMFYKQDAEKIYTVGTVGNCYKAECIGEVQLAAWMNGGKALHIGDKFNSNPNVDYFSNVTDDNMRLLINTCKYFACLRRKDGFEIPAVEALLCGVRPIMFDTPNYRQWFDGLAIFIPEDNPSKVVKSLQAVFSKEPLAGDVEETKNRFNWKRSAGGFWERCL
jgi:hypothetical protein